MRFQFDPKKSERLRRNPKRGIGLEEAQEIWGYPRYVDRRRDDPEQYRAIGWVQGQLYSVMYDVRNDDHGGYCHLVTLWKSTKEEQKLYEENT